MLTHSLRFQTWYVYHEENVPFLIVIKFHIDTTLRNQNTIQEHPKRYQPNTKYNTKEVHHTLYNRCLSLLSLLLCLLNPSTANLMTSRASRRRIRTALVVRAPIWRRCHGVHTRTPQASKPGFRGLFLERDDQAELTGPASHRQSEKFLPRPRWKGPGQLHRKTCRPQQAYR